MTKGQLLPPGGLPCACTALRKASRAVTRMYDERFEATGMTITQYAVLSALERQPDQPLSRLAESMVMDRTSLYRLLAPLEDAGWLEITAGPGRSRIARLTKAGHDARARGLPVWRAAQSDFEKRFGREQWAMLASALGRVVDAADAADEGR